MIGVTSTLSQILELIICADEDDVSECANATLKTVAADCIACIYDTCIHSGEYANGARASMSQNLHSRRLAELPEACFHLWDKYAGERPQAGHN